MCTKIELAQITGNMYERISELFHDDHIEMILFGSYAREEETDDSDIDLFFLVDTPRSDIARQNWQVGEIAAELLCSYGIVVSPIIENRDYFHTNADVLPLFKNILREGVILNA